ncbi:MAG: hypothetical protein ABI068_10735 [Ktedonobacterales bacterium]
MAHCQAKWAIRIVSSPHRQALRRDQRPEARVHPLADPGPIPGLTTSR